MANLTNPNPSLGDKRSTLEGGQHPFLSDAEVVLALALAVDRDLLSEIGYGPAGKANSNVSRRRHSMLRPPMMRI